MTRPRLIALLTAALVAVSGVQAQDPPKVDPPKADPPKSETPTTPGGDLIVHKFSAGDVTGTVSKVTGSQITLTIPQQVPNGFTTTNVKVANPVRPGHPVTYHTVKQQVPKYKTVQTDHTFDIGSTATVKTVGGKATDISAVTPGIPVLIHLTQVKEGKAGQKAESHIEVTRIVVGTAPGGTAVPPPASTDPSKKNN